MTLTEVDEFPPAVLAKMKGWSAEDFNKLHEHARRTMHKFSRKWVLWDGDEPVLFGGVFRQTLLGPPFFWFVTCEHFFLVWGGTIQFFKDNRDWFMGQYHELLVATHKEFPKAARFARYFGAEPSGTSGDWTLYRVK